MNEFQERLQDLLISNNLNRLQLANILGITSTTINGYFNKGYYPEINIAIKMANFFNCSLDYLFGLSDNPSPRIKNKNSFIENLDKLIKDNNISIARAMREMKMSEYNYYRWKNGGVPKTINLINIAKYFDTSMDFLVGNMK